MIFEDFFRPNCSVHSFSTRSKDNYNLPHFSKSVSQQSIEFKRAKIWNALPVEIRYCVLITYFKIKYLAQLTVTCYPHKNELNATTITTFGLTVSQVFFFEPTCLRRAFILLYSVKIWVLVNFYSVKISFCLVLRAMSFELMLKNRC